VSVVRSDLELGVVARGRYAIYHAGRECGEERWEVATTPDGLVASGEQELVSPHPFPNRQAYRVSLTREWRPIGLEILWTVGDQTLRATHAAEGGQWRVRIEHQGHQREQHGDFPETCEVEYGTPLFSAFILARRDFALEGEHEFPVLRIGPPMMAVSPERMLYRCVEVGTFDSPRGAVAAKRYLVSLPPGPESEGYTFWADAEGFVLASYEGLDVERPWMRLVEFERG
jgi:hypothetical protein